MIQWIDYKSNRILYLNWEHFKKDQVLKALNEPAAVYRSQNIESLLVLFNVESLYTDDEVIKKFNERARINRSHAVSIMGHNTVKKIIAGIIRNDIYFAGSLQDAKEWLTRQ